MELHHLQACSPRAIRPTHSREAGPHVVELHHLQACLPLSQSSSHLLTQSLTHCVYQITQLQAAGPQVVEQHMPVNRCWLCVGLVVCGVGWLVCVRRLRGVKAKESGWPSS